MKKSHVLLCVFLSALCGYSPIIHAQVERVADPEDMFESSLAELRSAMRGARSSNLELKEANRSLRQTVAGLEESLAMAGEPVLTVADLSGDVPSSEELSRKEEALYRSRLENLTLRQDRMRAQQARLKGRVEAYAKENQDAQAQIASLKSELNDMQVALRSPDSTNKADWVREKRRLNDGIASQLKRNKDLAAKISAQSQRTSSRPHPYEKLVQAQQKLLVQKTSLSEEFSRLQSEERLLAGASKNSPSLTSPQAQVLDEIRSLQDQRDQLAAAIARQKDAVRQVSPKETKDLQEIAKQQRELRDLLVKRLDMIRPGGALVARRANALEQRAQLKKEIALLALAQEEGVVVTADDLRDQLARAIERVVALNERMTSARSADPFMNRNHELTTEIAMLSRDLEDLRAEPQELVGQDAQAIKKEIADLEARRVILAKSVSDIYERFQLDQLPTQASAVKEAQLNEYFQTLTLENSALQERLLTLQMRQDKAVSGPQ